MFIYFSYLCQWKKLTNSSEFAMGGRQSLTGKSGSQAENRSEVIIAQSNTAEEQPILDSGRPTSSGVLL